MWYHQQQQQQQQQAEQQQPMIVVVMPQDQQQQQQAAQYQQQYGQPVQTQPVYQQYTQHPQLYQQQYAEAVSEHGMLAAAQWQQQHAAQLQQLQPPLPSWQPPAQSDSSPSLAPTVQQWQPQQQYLQQQQQQPLQAASQHWPQQDPVAPAHQLPPYDWQQQQHMAVPPWQQQQYMAAASAPHQPPAKGSSFPARRQQQKQQRQGGQQVVRQQGGQQQQKQQRSQQGGQPGGCQARPQGGQQQQQLRPPQQKSRPPQVQQQQQQRVPGSAQLGRRPQPDSKQQGQQQQAKRQRTSAPPAQGQPGAMQLQQQRQKQQQKQQQQQGPGIAGAAPGFNYQQWQQESQRWEAQLQQKRGGAAQERLPRQQQHQGQRSQSQQQQQQQKQKPKQKAQQQQQQQPGNPQQQQQQQSQGNAQKLSKKAKKTLKKQQAQQGQQQQQQQDASQAQFPLVRLPPRAVAAVARYLTDDERFKLARLLPVHSAAAAVLRGGVRKLLLLPRKPPRHVDVPESIRGLRGLQQLSMSLWMDGKIQARTGLSSLSSLSHLTSLQLTVDVAPELANSRKLGGKGKQGEAAPEHAAQQLQQAQQEASVKVQEDLWQITAALGRLTNLKQLQLNLSQYSIDRSREILKHVGYQTFAQLSGLTGLESLILKYSVCQAGSGLELLSGLSSLTQLSLEETGSGGTVIAGKHCFYLQANQEAGVAALSEVWRNAQNLRSARVRTPYLGPEAVGKFSVQPSLQVLDVSRCRLLFPRFRTTLEQLTALQELRISGCEGLTAADLATAASGLASCLTYLDISRNSKQGDGGVMRGSIAAIGQLTSLRHLNAYGTGIAAAAAGGGGRGASGSSSGPVCAMLSGLQQLTFLSIGSVYRNVMTISAEDVVHLSALTNLTVLHLQGAPLGVGLRESATRVEVTQPQDPQLAEGDLKPALTARLEFLRPLSGLSGLRLWACRFSHINRDRVQGIARLLLDNKGLVMKKHDVLDNKWYPGEEDPAEYSGDEADDAAAVGPSKSSLYRGVQLD